MEINYDSDADALYITFREGNFASNHKADDLTIIDYDKEGQILGIELLDASKRIPLSEVNVTNLPKSV